MGAQEGPNHPPTARLCTLGVPAAPRHEAGHPRCDPLSGRTLGCGPVPNTLWSRTLLHPHTELSLRKTAHVLRWPRWADAGRGLQAKPNGSCELQNFPENLVRELPLGTSSYF